MVKIQIILGTFILVLIISCTNNNDDNGSQFDKISDDSLLTLVQYRTFEYFHDGAEPVSGMARERFDVDGVYPDNDMNVVTSGGTGFGVMALLALVS